jgi:hypothetical protein
MGDELTEARVAGLKGVGGAAVRVLRLGRLSVLVSETEDDDRVAVTDENVLAHNHVNAAALTVSTLLPSRFGTRVAREQLAGYVSENEAALFNALERVRGCVEMSVKIMEKAKGKGQKARVGSEEKVKAGSEEERREFGEAGESSEFVENASETLERASESVESVAVGGRGTAFLLAKRREVLGEEALRLRADEVAAWLTVGVSGLVRETAARVSPSEAIVVRAAHLVERGRVAEYRERVRELSLERAGLRFLTSGPWPPYSFSELRG